MPTHTQHPLAIAVAGLVCFALPTSSQAANIVLADNSRVLQSWQEGGGAAPSLVQQPDGGTTIQWAANVSLDAYSANVTGGSTVTPLRDGSFYKATVQGDLRSTQPAGDLRYLQFSMTGTNDHAVLSHAAGTQIGSLQMGVAGDGYQLALGDVAAGFSTLGTNVGLRGLLAQKQLGQSVVSATAGVMAESWESLANVVDRTRYVRNVYAAKFETPMWETGKVYLTAQGYNDSESNLASGATTLAPASARLTTAGFSYQKDRFTLQGEAGFSRWEESGRAEESDRAYILDASWMFQRAGLRAGHHDIGKYYSSLAAQGGSGVKETYLNGNWMAADWLNLTADLRRSENALAGVPVITVPPMQASSNATQTDAFVAGAVITFGPNHPGWSLLLNHSQSLGENSGGETNQNRNYGATVSYADQNWNGNLGYMHGSLENGGAPTGDADTDTWQFNIGRNWMDITVQGAPAWTLSTNLGLSRQEQDLEIGGGPTTSRWQLGLSGQKSGLGTLMASYMDGLTTGQLSGDDIRQRAWQLEASHPFKGQNAVKLYWRNNKTSGSTTTPSADYREQVVGLQLLYVH